MFKEDKDRGKMQILLKLQNRDCMCVEQQVIVSYKAKMKILIEIEFEIEKNR